ncbi:hypothetical protein DUNSADRAFT_423 [Dunaliella salina]|uniref:VPS37 C-terminal domain-containing protein n=1 Tax=Dunaliella salina TaxID=3046 RepID=A0ABQ7FYZ5_DUNSA|nr:hypothetical protein DUNSADRAFT_423 [Dunaliella salina]|eukprot:KAF5827571.1 hypothetical protein DUNSADRAFT_423 [Dunaliella salina]
MQAARALDDVQSQNLAVAQENIAMQGALEEARNHVAIVKSSEYAAAKSIFDELLQSQRQVCACLAPSVLLDKLHAAVNEVDEQSIAVHDRFLKGELQPDRFAEQHTEIRQKFHLLDLKRQAARSSLYMSDA